MRGIEEMRIGARAGRGKVYAEQGQVTSLTVMGTHVVATVRGARPDPYVVKIDFAPLEIGGEGSPVNVREQFGDMTVGRILAGDMPTSVEELFSKEGLSPSEFKGLSPSESVMEIPRRRNRRDGSRTIASARR